MASMNYVNSNFLKWKSVMKIYVITKSTSYLLFLFLFNHIDKYVEW